MAKGFSCRCFVVRSLSRGCSSMVDAAMWKPPYPFTARILPSESNFPSHPHRVFGLDWFACVCRQIRFGTTSWTRYRLRMKPPIRGIFILFLAKTTQRKLAHGGVFSVVGQALDDCEAWTAICAGNKEVFKAGVFGVA